MGLNSIERVLWEVTDRPEQKVPAFLQDIDTLLEPYQLSDQDREMIKAKDVRAMSDMGVSPMLLMLFWMTVSGGPPSLGEYMQRMNTPA